MQLLQNFLEIIKQTKILMINPSSKYEDIFRKIGRANYYSSIDFVFAFYQIKMNPQSKNILLQGKWVLQMSFKIVSPTFHRGDNIIFSNISNNSYLINNLLLNIIILSEKF